MDLAALTPLLYYAVASVLTMASLTRHRTIRVLSLGPVWLFTVLSLISCHKLPGLLGANTTFASLVVSYFPFSIKILAIERHSVSPEISKNPSTIIDCYRIWNNPRQLPLRPSRLDKSTGCSGKSRAIFALFKTIKAAALWFLNSFAFQQILVWSFGNIMAADFSPKMESPFQLLSIHQIRIRAIMSVQWIWSAYFFLEFYNSLMAILFVAILPLDQPQDWPPLFGSLLEAYSVRGFWGRFWHRLTLPTYTCFAFPISRGLLGIPPRSRTEKTMIPLVIFTMSGLSHCLVGWALGESALARDFLFFQLNFLAAAIETAISKIDVPETLRGRFSLPRSIRVVVGMGWVYGFFFCIAPMWMYPKVYSALVGLIP